MADDDWISAFEASRLLENAGQNKRHARHALIRSAGAGLLRSRCRKLITTDLSHGAPPDEDDRTFENDAVLGPRFWAAVDQFNLRDGGDWESGDFAGQIDDGAAHMAAYRVQFFTADVLEFPILSVRPAQEGPQPPPSPPANRSRRGRRAAAYWEPLEADIKARIMSGEIRASQQSDIETAMKDKLAEDNEYPGEATIRRHAKPVWQWAQAQGS